LRGRRTASDGVHPLAQSVQLASLQVGSEEEFLLGVGEYHPAIAQFDNIADLREGHGQFGLECQSTLAFSPTAGQGAQHGGDKEPFKQLHPE
jgi:hypothetical protein